jgi:hypothetical protein
LDRVNWVRGVGLGWWARLGQVGWIWDRFEVACTRVGEIGVRFLGIRKKVSPGVGILGSSGVWLSRRWKLGQVQLAR